MRTAVTTVEVVAVAATASPLDWGMISVSWTEPDTTRAGGEGGGTDDGGRDDGSGAGSVKETCGIGISSVRVGVTKSEVLLMRVGVFTFGALTTIFVFVDVIAIEFWAVGVADID